MFKIFNKLKIFSAVILTLSTAATVFSACNTNKTDDIPLETVIGSQGEILGVSYYTAEAENETYTALVELTTSEATAKKSEKDKNIPAETIENKDSVSVEGSQLTETTQNKYKMTVRNNSSGVTLFTRSEVETKPQRPTMKKVTTQKSDSSAPALKQEQKETTKHVPISLVPKTKAERTTVRQTSVQTTESVTPTTKKNVVSDEKVAEISEGVNVVFKSDVVEKGNTASIMIQGNPGAKYSIDFYSNQTDVADYSELADQTSDENGFVTWTFRVPTNCESGARKIVVKEKGSDNYVQTSITVK